MGINPTYIQGYANSITSIINYIVVPVLISIAFLVFLWGIYKYFIKGSADEKAHTEGRTYIMYSIAGFVIIFSIWGIVQIFGGSLGLYGFNAPAFPTIGGSTGVSSGVPGYGTGSTTIPGTNYFSNVPISPSGGVAPISAALSKAIPTSLAASSKQVPKTGAAQNTASKANKSAPSGTCDPDPDGTTYKLGSDGMCAPTSCAPAANGTTYTLKGNQCIPDNDGCPPMDITDPSDPNSCVPGSASAACPPDANGQTYVETNDNCQPTNGGCLPNEITDPSDKNSCIPASASAACPPDENGQTYVETNDDCQPTNGGCLAGYTATSDGCEPPSSSSGTSDYGDTTSDYCSDGSDCPGGDCTQCTSNYGDTTSDYCSDGSDCPGGDCTQCTSNYGDTTSDYCSDGSDCPGGDCTQCPAASNNILH